MVSASEDNRIAPAGRQLICVLIGVVILRLWIMPLGSSFWADEAGTYWFVKDGIATMLDRAAHWHYAVTAFYGAITWTAYAAGGAREYVLRLPSLIAAGAAVALLYRLAQRFFNKDAALAAVACFVSTYPVLFSASDARPYSLVLSLVCAATLLLVRWLDTGRGWYGCCYVITAGLIPHAHYFASLVWPLHLIYALWRKREGASIPFSQLAGAALGIGLMGTPLIPGFLDVSGKTTKLAVGSTPTVRDVITQFVPLPQAVGLVIGLIAAILVCRKIGLADLKTPRSTAVLLFSLFLVPPLLFLVLGAVTGIHIFVPRYLIAMNVGQALLVGWAVTRIQPARARMVVVVSLALFPPAGMASWDRLWPSHSRDDWRDAMAATRRLAAGSRLPVIFEMPFIETFTTSTRPELSRTVPGFFCSPVLLYPAAKPVIPISLVLDNLSRSYLDSTVVPAVARDQRFVLITWLRPNPYDAWFEERFPGYRHSRLGDFGTVNATVFERKDAEIPPVGSPSPQLVRYSQGNRLPASNSAISSPSVCVSN